MIVLPENLPKLVSDDIPALLYVPDLPLGHGRSPLVICRPLWYCDRSWDEMGEEELSEWCTRLFEEEQDYELPIHLGILTD